MASPEPDKPSTVAEAIDVIEQTYELMLAYAAQGREREDGDPLGLYTRMREIAPAPFMGLVRLAGCDLLSASPELFLRRRGDDFPARAVDSGAILFTALAALLEIRHLMNDGDIYRPRSGLGELGLQVSTWLAMTIGFERIRVRTGSIVHQYAAWIFGLLAFVTIVLNEGGEVRWKYQSDDSEANEANALAPLGGGGVTAREQRLRGGD